MANNSQQSDFLSSNLVALMDHFYKYAKRYDRDIAGAFDQDLRPAVLAEIEHQIKVNEANREIWIEVGAENKKLRATLERIKARIESVPVNQRENDEIAVLEMAEDALRPADETTAVTGGPACAHPVGNYTCPTCGIRVST